MSQVSLVVSRPRDPVLAKLLETHPCVSLGSSVGQNELDFCMGAWRRKLFVGDSSQEIRGLVELMDNNPLVCADSASVPSPMGTLCLIALGPLFRAGMVVEPPVIHTNAPGSCEGFLEEVQVEFEEQDLDSVYIATAMAVITTPDDWKEIDELYEESFGRSFYVRSSTEADWNIASVAGRPWAIYRLRMTPDEPHSLLTIQVMADRNGKCGAAQVVHAMNVMAGLEECLGIPELIPT